MGAIVTELSPIHFKYSTLKHILVYTLLARLFQRRTHYACLIVPTGSLFLSVFGSPNAALSHCTTVGGGCDSVPDKAIPSNGRDSMKTAVSCAGCLSSEARCRIH
ncbi:hypothetical protein BaRGS_00016411 [Batillaria attramentaria]|uniref:Uncharacterized protein n=1 Tax=Batillaria attramentaria TaxID=370345 RepID=A0ABD0KYM3_9CAEN